MDLSEDSQEVSMEPEEYGSVHEGTVKAVVQRSENIEITQQQLGRIFAVLLLCFFTLFLSGYTLGKYRTVKYEGAVKASTMFDLLFERATYDAHSLAHSEKLSNGDYARFARFEEADKLCKDLVKRGYHVQVVTRNSSTASGNCFVHYFVTQVGEQESGEDVEIEESSKENLKKGVESHD